jgi:penicillin-binding protein 2
MSRAVPVRDSSRLRLAILGVVVLSLFATMLARLWYLQVLASPDLKVEAQANAVRLIYSEAPRGRILDREGRVLVENRIVPTLVADRQAMADQPDLLPRLAAELAGLPGVSLPEWEKRINDPRFTQYKPVPLVSDLPKEKVVHLREHQSEFPGVNVVQLTQRSYPNGPLAAHLLGYVAEINDRELAPRRSQGYREGDTIGKSGVEYAYETALRGTPEVEKLQVDVHDQVLRSLGKQPAVPGHDVLLTIDLEVQRVVEESLQQGLDAAHRAYDTKQAKYFIGPAGSVVVLDPRDGSVLAMASWPSYDPNQFAGGISTTLFQQLQDPANNFPLNNRAIQGLYAPGSTFKLVTGLAALDRQVIAPTTTIDDTGSIAIGDRLFRNALGLSHGPVNMAKALKVSSDVYFYKLDRKSVV